MSSLESYFNRHSFGLWLVLLLAVGILIAWLAITTIQQRNQRVAFQSILGEVESGNVPAMLSEYLATVRKINLQSTEVAERVDYLFQSLPGLVNHVGLVRFSPFHDTGGDQSFSVAILDGRGDGVVLSALHSRKDSKLYAKPIIAKSSQYALTEEEKRAIIQAGSTDDSTHTQS